METKFYITIKIICVLEKSMVIIYPNAKCINCTNNDFAQNPFLCILRVSL